MARKKAGGNRVEVGNIGDIRGEVTIASGDITLYKGYSAQQVSVLLDQITSTFQPKPFDGRCPYKGLDFFEEEDAELFFGRERLVEDLVSRVKKSQTVFITGPSGSGKSSLVRAGLIHSLKQGAIKSLHSERWLYATVKPGREPLTNLALAFSRLKRPELADYFQAHVDKIDILNKCAESVLSENKDQRFVLFIDQFEEVFTQINKEEERTVFLNLLTHAVTTENGRVIILFAMRSDFVSNCATYPKLNELLNQQFMQIGAMQPNELVSAIAQPALRVGLRIDPDLIVQIINDMRGEPGILPLMQFALKDLFDAQQSKGGVIALILNDYLQLGGVHSALERHANDAFKELNEYEQELARSIFSSLIEIGRGTQDTARTANFDELIPAGTNVEDVNVIVRKLADARLITTDEVAGKDIVTLSHEKLIDAWPWLKKLVNENRDAIAMRNEIASDAKEWDDHRRDASYLYTGARLIKAREELDANKLVLTELAEEFVEAAQTRQRRSQVVAISGVALVIGLLVFAVFFFSRLSTQNARTASTAQAVSTLAVSNASTAQAASTLAIFNQQEAVQAKATTESTLNITQDQFRKARIQALSAQSEQIGKESPSISILLALEAIKLNQASNEPVSHEAYQALRNALTNAQGIPVEGNSQAVLAMQYSKAGSWFATGGKDGTVRVWDLGRSQVPGAFSFSFHCDQGEVQELVFSDNDSQLVSRGSNKTICIWDLSTSDPSQAVHQFKVDLSTIDDFSVSSNGHWAAAGSVEANQVLVWDLRNSKLLDILEMGDNASSGPLHLAFNPEGTILLLANDSALEFWSIKTTGMERMPGGGTLISDGSALVANSLIHIRQLQFTPEGQRIIGLGYSDYSAGNVIFILNAIPFLQSPRVFGIKLGNRYDYERLQQISISPDGRWLAGGNNNTIWLWNLTSLGHNPVRLAGHQAPINELAFSKDGHWLASASGPFSEGSNVQGDGTVRLWDLQAANPGEAHMMISAGLGKNLLAFDARSNWLTVSNGDQLIRLFDLTTKKFSIEPVEFSDALTLSGHNNSDGNTATNWRILQDPYTGSYRVGNALALPFSILRKLRPGTSIYGYRPNENQPIYAKCDTSGRNCDVSEIDVYLAASPTAQAVISDDQFIRTIATVHFTEDKHWMFITGYSSDGYGLYLVNLTEKRPLIRKPYHILPAPYYWGDVRYLASIVYNNRWLFASTDAGLTYLDLNLPDPVATRKYMSGLIPVALSPDGHWLANGEIADGKLGLFPLSKLDQGATANISLGTPVSASSEVLFSADSRWLMFSNDTQFSIWDVSKTSPDAALTIPMSLRRRRLSQDRHWLGLLDQSGRITIVNLSGDNATIQDFLFDAQGGYIDLAFSPDGRWFSAVDNTGNLSLYDLSNTGKEPLIPNRALNALTSLAFNSDKHNIMVVGGTSNGKILLWNLSDLLNDPHGLPIVLQGGVKAYDQIAFTPDNNWLLAYGANEPLKAWRANFEDILNFACEGAGRNLSREEWARYGFTEEYRATCPQWGVEK